MNKRVIQYDIINLAVIGITVCFFVYEYKNIAELFADKSFFSILILLVSAMLVHSIKAGRLYLALYGSGIGFKTYLKAYCKVTPVSIVLPFKSGELFRMYCYGTQMKSGLKGIVIILLDRFMDTIALVTTILIVWIFNGGRISSFAYVLIIFLVFVLLVYIVFPGVYSFWKKYLLCAKATDNKLAALKVMDKLYLIYREIAGVVKGRGIILYFLSLLAWGIEIGSIGLQIGVIENGRWNQTISAYLLSAMGGSQSLLLKQFVFVSILLLMILYVGMKMWELYVEKRNNR
ncbi:MAG: lysylphosphatidylglycerol synthase domain-containing protein [Lachnospiraceae bacterium]